MMYRKRPIVIEAIQWRGDNLADLTFWGATTTSNAGGGPLYLYVEANKAWLALTLNEWVIKDKAGYYPCLDEIFRATYELAV